MQPNRMKPAARTTIIAFATSICVIAWTLATIGVAGVWLDCIPSDPEYGCTTTTAAWERTIGLVAAVAILTVVMWLAARRLTSRR